MEYIVYKRFKNKAICGSINIPAMAKCTEHNNIIYYNEKPICFASSENAHHYFAINEDGKGLLRGKIICEILAILKRKDDDYQMRWDKIWNDALCQKYKRPEHPSHWLWNHDFYNASINDLEYILKLIKSK